MMWFVIFIFVLTLPDILNIILLIVKEKKDQEIYHLKGENYDLKYQVKQLRDALERRK